MDEVEKTYQEGKLLVRAMDQPMLRKIDDNKYYECQTWVDEFTYLMNDGLYSLSTTLIVSNVGVKTYKNIGFLVNSDLADCFHITKGDSGSNGNIKDGDFFANKADFTSILELAQYIKENNVTTMNEVNINVKLDAIIGLFINKCMASHELLKNIFVVNNMLKNLTGIEYPIYLYDFNIGKMEKIDLSKEQEDELVSSLASDKIFCWPDGFDNPYFVPIEVSKYQK